jgi:hypothetical protein
MSFEVNCATRRKNTGIAGLCQDIGPLSGYIITPYNWETTEANALLKATYDTAISAAEGLRIYPFPPAVAMTDNSEDTVFEELALGNLFVKDGKVNLMFMHESSRYKHEALKSHTLQKVGVILIDQQGRLHGVREGEKFQAIKLQQFVVGRLNINDGAGIATKTSVTMIFADTNKWETSPAVVAGLDWSPNDLQGLIDVNLIAGVSTGSALRVTIKSDKSGDPFTAIVGDFVVKNPAGVVQTITSVTPPVNGLHVLNFTTPLTAAVYSVDLLPPATMVTKGYESTGPVSITIT